MLGDRIKSLRKAKRLTQQQLADLSEVHINTIGLIERNEFLPSLLVAICIADALGVSLDYLVGREV